LGRRRIQWALLSEGTKADAGHRIPAYIKLRHISTQPLVQNLTVETPEGKKVLCDKMVVNCPINIKGRNLPINLLVFKSLGYDVILGMDRCFANIYLNK